MSYNYAPPPPYGQPAGPPPNNWLVPSILATIFCCLPFGVAAIVFAAQVNGKYQMGDYAGAQQSAQRAKTFTIVSAAVGVVVIAIYIVALAAGAFGASSSS